MKKAEVIAYHGWGFDASCWNTWKQYLGEEIALLAYDRGYFSSERQPQFSPGGHSRIVFAHSFGLHLCSEEVLSQADLLVVFGGFLSFHPRAAQFKRRSRLVINQMISRFKEEPRQVLEAFYQNVFYPQQQELKLPDAPLNESLLLQDLIVLNEQELEPKQLNKISKICILHGFEDSIVSRAKGRELFDELKPKTKYMEVKKAGHALPFANTEQCWSFIQPEVE